MSVVGVPHLHVHLVPRHADDPAAGVPLEHDAFNFSASEPLSSDTLDAETVALAGLVASQS